MLQQNNVTAGREGGAPENAFLLLLDSDLEWELLQLVQQFNALFLHDTPSHCSSPWTDVVVCFVCFAKNTLHAMVPVTSGEMHLPCCCRPIDCH